MQRVRCDATNGKTTACWDGYADLTLPNQDCKGSCGIQKYGQATFNARFMVSTS